MIRHLAFIKSELTEGIKVESEHKDLVNKIREQIKKYGTIKLTDKEIYAIIAKTHIKEKSNYYKLLKKYIEPKEIKKSYDLVFLKSKNYDSDLIKAIQQASHKYIRKIGTGNNARYIYKEKELTKEQFHKFMEAQAQEMQKYRQKVSQQLGYDIGEKAYHQWIKSFAKKFRELWMKKYHLLVFK